MFGDQAIYTLYFVCTVMNSKILLYFQFVHGWFTVLSIALKFLKIWKSSVLIDLWDPFEWAAKERLLYAMNGLKRFLLYSMRKLWFEIFSFEVFLGFLVILLVWKQFLFFTFIRCQYPRLINFILIGLLNCSSQAYVIKVHGLLHFSLSCVNGWFDLTLHIVPLF